MNTRYLSRIGILQLKSPSTFTHRWTSTSRLALKLNFKPATTSKHEIKPTATFKEELDNVQIRTRRSPSNKDPDPASHVNEILASSAFNHREFGHTAVPGGFRIVQFYIKNKDVNSEKARLVFGFRIQNPRFLKQARYTLARFLERWPHALVFGPNYKNVLVDVALERTPSKVSKKYPTIEFYRPKSIFRSTVRGIDPDSGKLYSVSVAVRPEDITNIEVPETPETEDFALKDDNSDKGSKHKAAIKVLQLVLWKYHNKILRRSDVEYAIEEIILKYAAETQGSLLVPKQDISGAGELRGH